MGDENTQTLEQLRAENEKLKAQVLEYEQTLDSTMKENELLKVDVQRFARENDDLRAACKALEKGASMEASAKAEAPSMLQPETRRYRARFRLGLSRGDMMPGEEFEASEEEIEGLRIGTDLEVV
jgi:cell division septum initiation protein DivIVA